MSCQFPYRSDLKDAESGSTFDGRRWDYAGSYGLARVTVTVTSSAGVATVYDSLDDSGVTIIDGTAESWSYQFDPIKRVSLAAGNYSYEVHVYQDIDEDEVANDSDDYRRKHFYGNWKIT